MFGPWNKLPLEECHVSPLLSRSKDNDSRQIIVDLSFDPEQFVIGRTPRGFYDGQPYELTLPNLDCLLGDILKCEQPKLIKVDIVCAFRNVRIDPGDSVKLAIQHQGKFYIDKSLAFGAANGTVIFQRISDAIRRILLNEEINVWNYIDDIFACVDHTEAHRVFNRLVQLIQELGLPINLDKVVAPADGMTCMGIEVDARRHTVRLPQTKINEAVEIVKSFEGVASVTRQKYQLLLGKFLYVAKIVIPARPFLNRMLHYLCCQKGANRIALSEQFHRDLCLFRKLLITFNKGALFDIVMGKGEVTVFVDPSLLGMGRIGKEQLM